MLISMETAIMIIINIIIINIWWHVLLISYTDCVGNYNVYSALLPETYFNVFWEERMNLRVYPTARIQRKLTWRRPSAGIDQLTRSL